MNETEPSRALSRDLPVRPVQRIALPERPGLVSHTSGEIHLWYCRWRDLASPALREQYLAYLSPEERDRYCRFLVPGARDEYLITRALVREVLSRYSAAAPAEWVFARTSYGRPLVVSPRIAPLDFNLSHSHGLIVCAISDHRALGVDTEHTGRAPDAEGIANHSFSPAEAEALRALLPAERAARFTWLWTLKEAYIKARGLGLSLPLQSMSFSFPDAERNALAAAASDTGNFGELDVPLRVAFEPSLQDDASSWRFGLLRAAADHVLAYAAKGEETVRLRAAELFLTARGLSPVAPESEA